MPGNLLASETSPYLLQHKDNPVHWRPWGAEALNEAKEANNHYSFRSGMPRAIGVMSWRMKVLKTKKPLR